MAIEKAILNGGKVISITASASPLKEGIKTGERDKEGKEAKEDGIPTLVVPNLENSHDEGNFFKIGDLPILRLIPPINTVNQDSLMNFQSQFRGPSNFSREREDVPTSHQRALIGNIEDLEDQRPDTVTNDEDLERWTLVQRKKMKPTSQVSKANRTQQSYFQIHANKLRQQKKCFKCLTKGHIQAVCRNPRRCLHCNLIGHTVRNCPSMPEGNSKGGLFRSTQRRTDFYKKEAPLPPKKAHPFNIPLRASSKKPPLKKQQPSKQNMEAPRNWLAMEMNCPGEIWQQRPHHLNVYLAPREDLSPANLFLERSAFIFAGPGRSDPLLKQRIANYMGRQFHCDASEFGVHVIDEDFGDVLLIFPNSDMAKAAIDRGTFYIGHNIEIALHPYSLELQLAFDPLGGRARIRLYGVPLNHWNRVDMATLVAGFGYPLRVAPYISNGNYHYLTMMVACKKAEEVPFYLKLNVNPRKKDIRVQMEGWISHQRAQPPHHGDDSQDRREGRRDQRDRSGGVRFQSPRRSTVGRSYRDQEGDRTQRTDGNHSSIGSNRSRAAQDWIDGLKINLMAAGLLQDVGTAQHEGKQLRIASGPVAITNAELRKKDKGKALAINSPITGKFTTDKLGTKVLISQTLISDGNQTFMGTLAVVTHEYIPNGGFKFMCLEKGMINETMNSVEYIQETEMGYHTVYANGPASSKRASLQLIEEGTSSGAGAGIVLIQDNSIPKSDFAHQVGQEMGHKFFDENQGPPPGFEFLASVTKEFKCGGRLKKRLRR